MDESLSQFVALELSERQERLSLAKKKVKTLSIWDTEKKCPEVHFLNLYDKDEQIFAVREELPFNKGSEVRVSFELMGAYYLSKAKVCFEDSVWMLEFVGPLFKSEKRKSERLLTYPHYKFFAEIKRDTKDSQKSESSMLYFNRVPENDRKYLEEYDRKYGTQFKPQKDHEQYRVLNLSEEGAALLVHKSHLEQFNCGQINEGWELLFHQERYVMPVAEVLYIIDYVESSLDNAHYSKVGIHFSRCEFLKDYFSDISPVSSEDILKDEFSNFVERKEE